jgi:outer membrane protein W
MMYQPVKQIICLFLIFLCVASAASNVYAQKRNRQVVSIGPKVGVNFSNLHGDVSNQAMQPGLSAGAILTYSVVNTFGISVEALYSQKGAKFENAPFSSNQRINFNRRLNYVEVPLLARYFLNKEGNFRPNVFLGPNFGFKLNGKDVNREVVSGTAQPDADISNAINPVDVGITGGIGLNLRLQESLRALLDVRYTHGISNIADSQLTGFTVANPTVGNNAITVTLGLSFGIGKKYEK